MNKNEILNSVIKNLASQREYLLFELRNINYNETSYFNKQSVLENQIMNIDNQISIRISEIEANLLNK